MAKTNRLKQTDKDGLSYKSIFHGTSSMPDGVYRYFSWETRKLYKFINGTVTTEIFFPNLVKQFVRTSNTKNI